MIFLPLTHTKVGRAKFLGHDAAHLKSNGHSGECTALLLGFAALAAELGACWQFRAAAGTFTGRQGSAASLAEARFVRIGAPALGARIAGIAPTWASVLWISLIAAMFGTATMIALIAAVVASISAAHQIAQHSFEESHGLLLCS